MGWVFENVFVKVHVKNHCSGWRTYIEIKGVICSSYISSCSECLLRTVSWNSTCWRACPFERPCPVTTAAAFLLLMYAFCLWPIHVINMWSLFRYVCLIFFFICASGVTTSCDFHIRPLLNWYSLVRGASWLPFSFSSHRSCLNSVCGFTHEHL